MPSSGKAWAKRRSCWKPDSAAARRLPGILGRAARFDRGNLGRENRGRAVQLKTRHGRAVTHGLAHSQERPHLTAAQADVIAGPLAHLAAGLMHDDLLFHLRPTTGAG